MKQQSDLRHRPSYFPKPSKRLIEEFGHLADTHDGDHVILRMRRQVDVTVSPLFVQAIGEMIEHLRLNENFDRVIDEIQMSYVSDYLDGREAPPHGIHLTIYVPNISFRSFQDVLQADDIRIIGIQGQSQTPEILSLVQISLGETTLHYNQVVHRRTAGTADDGHPLVHRSVDRSVSFKVVRCEVEIVHTNTFYPTPQPNHRPSDRLPTQGTVLHLAVDGASGHFHSSSTQTLSTSFHLGDISLRFNDSAAELVIGSTFAWMRVISGLMTTVSRAQKRRADNRLQIIYTALSFVSANDIKTEPLFRQRGSFLVTWTSRSLRFDMQWQVRRIAFPQICLMLSSHQVLAYLRHCLRQMDNGTALELASSLQEELSDEDLSQMRNTSRHLLDLRQDPNLDMPMPAVDLWLGFKSTSKMSKPSTWESLKVLFHAGIFTVTILDPTDGGNRLRAGPFDLVARSQKIHLQHHSQRKELVWAARLAVGPILISVNPELLTLVRHILRVRQVFEDKIQSLYLRRHIPQPSTAEAPNTLVRAEVSLGIEQVVLSAEAHGVIVSFKADRPHTFATGIWPTGAVSHYTQTEFTVFLGFDMVGINASEARVGGPQITGQQLASTTLSSVRLHTVISGDHSPSTWFSRSTVVESRPSCSVVGGVNRIEIRVPYSILKIYAFFEEWSQVGLPQSKFVLEALKRDLDKTRTPVTVRSELQPSLPLQSPLWEAFRFDVHMYLPTLAATMQVRHPHCRSITTYSISSCSLIRQGRLAISQMSW